MVPGIDVQDPRFGQGVATALLLLGFIADVPAVVPLVALGLVAVALFAPEAARPPRFAAALEIGLLVVATLALLGGLSWLGWVVVLVVAGLAGLAAGAGIYVRSPA